MAIEIRYTAKSIDDVVALFDQKAQDLSEIAALTKSSKQADKVLAEAVAWRAAADILRYTVFE